MDKIAPNDLYKDNRSICGFNLNQLLFKQGQEEYVRSVVMKLFRLYSEGRIRPCIDSTWALEDVSTNFQYKMKNMFSNSIDYVYEKTASI